ncbi:uncharacterized protein LOC109832301 [Asparagus officinalis]|uniref:uncharacterized protein LOC109832301 n=1 Tax=Asparagus officinalis TaxID=4686 RepID=UPI00098E0E27|nr:uncharacterized protein LOC109832301 [Asparagus officinalis]
MAFFLEDPRPGVAMQSLFDIEDNHRTSILPPIDENRRRRRPLLHLILMLHWRGQELLRCERSMEHNLGILLVQDQRQQCFTKSAINLSRKFKSKMKRTTVFKQKLQCTKFEPL